MDELKVFRMHVDALFNGVNHDKEFFSAISHYVRQLKDSISPENINKDTKSEILIIANEIDDFFAKYRLDPESEFPYIPPDGISKNDDTSVKIKTLASKIGAMDDSAFEKLLPKSKESKETPKEKNYIETSLSIIEKICARFHLVVRQLRERHDSRPTLDVDDEYDVQDLIHALLKLFFEDIRPEEWTPSYAGKSSRMDFLLKNHRTVIEIKKTRKGLGAKEVGTQLIDDIVRYRKHSDCKVLICFVYDPEGRITNPRGLENDLSHQDKDIEVKILIRPTGK